MEEHLIKARYLSHDSVCLAPFHAGSKYQLQGEVKLLPQKALRLVTLLSKGKGVITGLPFFVNSVAHCYILLPSFLPSPPKPDRSQDTSTSHAGLHARRINEVV